MAYDEDLADRVRELIYPVEGLEEKKMFGGLAFLIGGHMAIAVSGQGGLLVRVEPQDGERLVETSPAKFMVMRGRPMEGWLRVPAEHVGTKRQLAKWVSLGTTYASSLPAKTKGR